MRLISDGDYIAHHGIKGQKWGIRRYRNEDGTLTEAGRKRYEKTQDRQAKKDAKEYARARMYYGEGAGTRRKQIKAVVDQRSKDPFYKKQFESYLKNQDMSEHATKARAERKVRDAASWTGKTAKGIGNLIVGNAVPVATSAVAIYSLARMTGLDEIAIQKGKEIYNRFF